MMFKVSRIFKSAGLWVALFSSLQADPQWTDNRQPPYLAIWKEPKYQPEGINQYNTWLNRTRTWVDMSPCFFYTPAKTWAEWEMPFDPMWSKWMTEVPGRRAILTLPMFPPDGSTLALGAKGTYDAHFAALAKNLAANNLGDTIICMGPATAYGTPWKVSNKEDAGNFVQFWHHIVTAMRGVSGAEKVQFDWIIPNGKLNYSIEDAYPAKDDVDYIGFVAEEGSGNPTIYPYPPFASKGERLFRQKRAWDIIEQPNLDKWCDFAKAHGKPFSLPRWNLAADHTRSEGFDDPYFIEAMGKYIQDPAHNIYFASYFEYYHYSWLSPTNDYKTNEPGAAEAFQKSFALTSAK
jgi:hypothetical protein